MSKPKTCVNCTLTWTREHNVKDVVLCPLHASAPDLLAALERIQQRCTGSALYGLTIKEVVMIESLAGAAIAKAQETK